MNDKTTKLHWTVEYSTKAKRLKKKLPKKIQIQIDLLAKEIELLGPIRKEWSHFDTLKKSKRIPDNAYHCHVQSGRPTYVVCWRLESKIINIVEIFYVGTHEGAPY
jgi:hypothetical protein